MARKVNTKATRGNFRVADRHECAAGRRAQEIDEREAGQRGKREAKVVEALGAAQPIAEQFDRLEQLAAAAAGHRLPARDDLFDRSEEHTSELQSHLNLVC